MSIAPSYLKTKTKLTQEQSLRS